MVSPNQASGVLEKNSNYKATPSLGPALSVFWVGGVGGSIESQSQTKATPIN